LNDKRKLDKITTVIFDMDGTLIEHTWQLSRICEALYNRFEDKLSPVSVDAFFDLYWTKSTDMWYMMVDGIIDGEIAATYGFAHTLRGLNLDPKLATLMLNAWRDLVLEEAMPFEDTYHVLTALRQKYTTGILTNGFTVLQRQKLNKYRLAEYVDFTLVSEEAGYHKPDPRVFGAALKLAGDAMPEETLYVGDNPVTDIQGSLAANLVPVFINIRYSGKPPDDVIEISALSDLLPMLGLR
jgi:HAD superfamily hydrolase (TIGR01549 family)